MSSVVSELQVDAVQASVILSHLLMPKRPLDRGLCLLSAVDQNAFLVDAVRVWRKDKCLFACPRQYKLAREIGWKIDTPLSSRVAGGV